MDTARALASTSVSESGPRFRTARGISLVLPAYNEEAVIEQAIREAATALAAVAASYEIIVVDDGSKDRTREIATRVAAEVPHVRVVAQPQNMGYGAALKRGFSEATQELVGFTDSDCQFNLAELDRLALLAEEYDIVSGYRIDRQDPWLRLVYSRSYNALIGCLLGTSVRDADCALKLFRREVVQNIEIETRGYLVNAEILAKAHAQGYSVVEVGVTHRERAGGKSKVSVLDVFPVLCALARFWFTWAMFPRATDAAPKNATPQIPGDWTARQAAVAFAGLMVVASVMFFGNLSYPLMEPDESRYAQIGLEMFQTGDYVVPRKFGEPYLDKPPMLYWLTAASYAVLGVNEAAARVPAGLAALGTLAMTVLLGQRLMGRRAAFLGGCLLLASAGFLLAGRYILMDGLLTFFTTSSFLCLFLAIGQREIRVSWWMLGSVACALGLLTKGPIALVLCLPPLIAFRWLYGEKPIRFWHWAALGGVCAATFIPWLVAVQAHESDFVSYFFWKHNVVRFTSAFNHKEAWWFYLPMLPACMLPASLLLPVHGALLVSRREGLRALRTPEVGFLTLAAVWIVGFFSLSSCKLPPYVLPAWPLVCLAAGRTLEAIIFHASARTNLAWYAKTLERWLLGGAVVSTAAMAAATLVLLPAENVPLAWAVLLGGVALGGLVLVANPRLRQAATLWRYFGAGNAIFLACAFLAFYPHAASWRSANDEALLVEAELDDASRPVVYYNREAGFSQFWREGRVVRQFGEQSRDELAALARHEPRLLIITNSSDREELAKLLPAFIELRGGSKRGRVFVTEVRNQREIVADHRDDSVMR